jgi:predicted nucleotidyltransferase
MTSREEILKTLGSLTGELRKARFLEERLHHRVDIIPVRALREELKEAVLADVRYV